jgi:hypothetical protein
MAQGETEAARLARLRIAFERSRSAGVSIEQARSLIRLDQIDARRLEREARRARRREAMAEEAEGGFWWQKGPMA